MVKPKLWHGVTTGGLTKAYDGTVNWAWNATGGSHVDSSPQLNCFMHGTIFRTLKDNTEVPIEVQFLKVGDLVKTESYVNIDHVQH